MPATLLNLGSPLAQSSPPTSQILTWVFALIILIVVGGLVVIAMRRKLLSKDSFIGHESGLMDEMRGMHARGELTTEEYDRIRKRLVAKAAGKDPDAIAAKPEPTGPKASRERTAKPGFDLAGDPLPEPDLKADPTGHEKTPEDGVPDKSSPKPSEDHDPDGFPDASWPERSQ